MTQETQVTVNNSSSTLIPPGKSETDATELEQLFSFPEENNNKISSCSATKRRKSSAAARIIQPFIEQQRSKLRLDQMVENYDKKSNLGELKLRKLIRNIRDIRRAEKENSDRIRLLLKRFMRKLNTLAYVDPDVLNIISILNENYQMTENILWRTSQVIRSFGKVEQHQIYSHHQLLSSAVPAIIRSTLHPQSSTKVDQLRKQFMKQRGARHRGYKLR